MTLWPAGMAISLTDPFSGSSTFHSSNWFTQSSHCWQKQALCVTQSSHHWQRAGTLRYTIVTPLAASRHSALHNRHTIGSEQALCVTQSSHCWKHTGTLRYSSVDRHKHVYYKSCYDKQAI
jgi:hypothetical protein